MDSDLRVAPGVVERPTFAEIIKTISSLFKLRIVMLLLFAAAGGAFLGAEGVPSMKAIIAIIITGTLSAGGSSAINQYLEQSSDAKMQRTQRRPLPAGAINHPRAVLWLAIAMIIGAVGAVLPFNPAMSLYLGLGAVVYVGIYTIWLKPRSVLNIVIGGAAGSMAVMTGGAAVGAAGNPGVIVLALLVFLWTPVHFWALAMFYRDDYAAADVPMLPVRASATHTAWWILIHAISTGLAAVVLAAMPSLGWIYLIPAGLITTALLVSSVRLVLNPVRKQAIKTFILSNTFLALVLGAVMAASTVHHIFFS